MPAKGVRIMKTNPVRFHLLPPQKVSGSEQIAPLQYTIKDTARLLSLSRRTVERLIARGELATIGQGKLKRLPYDSIVAYLGRHRNDQELAYGT
jgi:excisionase family DNA binding protein